MPGTGRNNDRADARPSDGAPQKQRVDKWLFFARIVKSRTLAAKAVELGRVRINAEKAASAASSVKLGDVLTVTLDRRIGVYRVLGPGDQRGPASEARLLYEDLSPQPGPDAAPPDEIDRLAAAKRN